MSGDKIKPRRCPDCGAEFLLSQSQCWLCSRKAPEATTENPYASPQLIHESKYRAGQFSIATLMLVTTLVAVCLGVGMLAPGLGILLAIVATPALVRTVVADSRTKAAGWPFTMTKKIETFIVSLFLAGAVGMAGVVAFMGACTVGLMASGAFVSSSGPSGDAFGVALFLGAVAAIGVMGWLFWVTRPQPP